MFGLSGNESSQAVRQSCAPGFEMVDIRFPLRVQAFATKHVRRVVCGLHAFIFYSRCPSALRNTLRRTINSTTNSTPHLALPGRGPLSSSTLMVRRASPPLSETLSRESCKTACADAGFPFYGLEWSILCYCGGKETTKARFIEGLEEYKLADATEACSMPCPVGETGDTCGGSGAIEIWEV